MKKLSILFLLFAVLSLGCLAVEDSTQKVTLTYDTAEQVIKAEISVLTGDAIVGHFGLSYNTQKLTLVTSDGSSLPTVIPEKGADGKSYLTAVVQAANKEIVVTTESNKSADLLLPSAGKVLFGWYATKNVEAVTPSLDGGRIAVIRFKLADGVTPNDLNNTDLVPVSAADCAGISGWSNGIIVINSQSKIFTYAAVEGTSALRIDVTADFSAYTAAETPPEKDPTSGETTPPEPDKEPEKEPEKDPAANPEADPAKQPEKEPEKEPDNTGESTSGSKDTSVITELDLQAHTYAEKIRFLWQTPSKNVESYTLVLTDSDGQTVRRIESLVDITKSVTVAGLAPDYPLTAALIAYDTSGKELASASLSVRTDSPDADSLPVAFTVTYDAGIGEFYGFENEEVLFGSSPTKAPRVYAPEGYTFAGWSIEGEETVELSKLRVYEDLHLIAVYTEE